MLKDLIKNKHIQFFIKLLIVILLLEVSLFNYYHWKSLNYESKGMENFSYEYGSGLSKNEDGSYTLVDAKNAYINITEINTHIGNVFIDTENLNNRAVNMDIYADDEANSSQIKCGAVSVFGEQFKTNYINLNLSGETQSLKIYFTDNQEKIIINNITINKTVPLSVSFIRIVLELIIVLFFGVFRPKSKLYTISLFSDSKIKNILICGFMMIQVVTIVWLGGVINPDKSLQDSIENDWPAHGQYTELAEALINGKVYLEEKPPESLKNAENPYDPVQRWRVVVEEGKEMFRWDYAYFDGKYYTYFGVVPAVLFFVPYKLITGESLNTWDIVTLCSALFAMSAFWFVYELCKKYFKNVNIGIYLLLSQFLIFGSSLVYLVYFGNVYSLPIITSLLFGIVGLVFWLKASQNGKISKIRLLIGSLFIALILGCRPQLVLIFLMAIPIFWDETIRERRFFSVKGFINTTVIILPFIIVGLGMMYYNNLRFNSPFDFGANYNLTGNDMTHRGLVFDRFPLGIMVYILEPLTIVNKFPFIKVGDLSNDYIGNTSMEPYMGGIFAFNTLMVINLFIFKLKKILKESKVYLFTMLLLVISVIIMLLDIQMSGLTQRYLSDFSWTIAMATIIIILSFDKQIYTKTKMNLNFFRGIILAGTSSCVFLHMWSIFVNGRYFPLYYCNPELYYYVKTMLPFY